VATQKFLNKAALAAWGEIEEGVKDSKDVVKETARRLRRGGDSPGARAMSNGIGKGKQLGGNGKWRFSLDMGWQPA